MWFASHLMVQNDGKGDYYYVIVMLVRDVEGSGI